MGFLKRITHCTFSCKDYPAAVRFYSETLGLQRIFTLEYDQGMIEAYREKGFKNLPHKQGDEWISYFKVAPREFIELNNLAYNGENNVKNQGFHHICLLVDNITAAAEDMKAKGLSLYDGPSWLNKPYQGGMCFFITDTEGNELEFMQQSHSNHFYEGEH